MEMFFKIGTSIVDVEDGNIVDTMNGKVMRIDFVNMTVKSFGTRIRLTPIRFNGEKELSVWDTARNKWIPLKHGLSADIAKAISKLIETKIEKELLG
jgi:hypothetical protein